MTVPRRNLRSILCTMFTVPLIAGCAQADLTTLQAQRAELSDINDQLERDVDGLDQELDALDLERDELLTDTQLTADTRRLTDSYIDQLRRIRNVGRAGSTSSSSGSTSSSSGGNASTTSTIAPKEALTITAYDISPGGSSGEVDMERGTISQTFDVSAANPIELTVVSDTPSTCALQQVTRVDGYKNRFNATFALVGTGDCSITASYPGDNTYEPATTTESITVM